VTGIILLTTVIIVKLTELLNQVK